MYTSFKYITFGEFVKGYHSHFRYEHWNALLTIVIIPIAKMRDIMSIVDSRYPANHAPWVFSCSSSWAHICVSYNMRKSKCMVMAKEIDWENDAFQSTCCISISNVLLIHIIYNFAKKCTVKSYFSNIYNGYIIWWAGLFPQTKLDVNFGNVTELSMFIKLHYLSIFVWRGCNY